jgi:hypothetical protein
METKPLCLHERFDAHDLLQMGVLVPVVELFVLALDRIGEYDHPIFFRHTLSPSI